MSARRWLVLALVAAAITLLAARAAAQFYTTWAWYHAMGAQEVWRARLAACALLRIIAGGAVTLFAFANFYAVRQSVISLVLPRRIGNLDIGEEVSSRALTTAAFVLAAVVGIILASSLDGWTSFLLARDGHLFGETDPYFTADLGFFVYWLPFEAELFTWATASVLCVLAVVVLLYLLTPGLRWERRRLYLSEYVRRHLAVLGGVLIILLAWHFRLDMYALVTDGSGPDGQFTWLDHRVGIPGMLILSVVTLGVGLIVIWGGWTGQRRLTTAAVAAGLLAGLVTQEVAPFVATHAATPLEATSRERPYASARAGYTRRAYGVDRVALAPSSIAYASLADAAHAVPAWDTPALARAIELESRLAAYPRVGWTRDSTGIVGVVAAPGQVPGPGQATPRGLAVRTLGAEASTTGDPVREFVSTADDDVSLLEPAVVLDSARGYLVVPDSGQRIAGVPLTSPLIRMAEALSVQNLRLWLEPLPQPRPLLVTVRNVRDRVAALAPFFVQGTAVAPLVVQDSLLWAVDLYSASSNYPLSRHASIAGEERSYFQHAATAIVSAATGRVQLVADSVLDPIAMTWVAKFPHLFSRASQLPPAVRSALPPALDGAWATATAFGEYGTRANSGVRQHPPVLDGADSALATGTPVVALPGGGPTAYEMPMLDEGDRVRGVFVAAGGSDHAMAWLPLDGLHSHWPTVLDRLRTADSLTTRSNAMRVRGVVRAVPVGDHAVFVQPVYEWGPAGAPTLAYVAVLFDDSVHVAPTLGQLAGRPATAGGTARPRAPDAGSIRELYQSMRDALRRGDWVAFGRAFDALGALLARGRP